MPSASHAIMPRHPGAEKPSRQTGHAAPERAMPVRHADSEADLPSREVLLSMSGLAFMQAMLDGQVVHPPVARLMNFHLISVEPGCVRFIGTPGFAQGNPMGALHGGWYGTILDSALGCAVMTTVPQGRWYTTLEYKVNITRALPLGKQAVATGTVDHAGRSTATARAELRAEDGRLYATGTTTCIILG